MDKVQFLIFIFTILLLNECSVSLCNSRKYSISFSIFKIAAVRYTKFSKTKTFRFIGTTRITMSNFIKIGGTVAEIRRFNGFQHGTFCIIVPNFTKIGQTVAETSRFLCMSRFLGPTRVHNPDGISIGSSTFAGLTLASNRHTHRPTDHTTSTAIGRIVMQSI